MKMTSSKELISIYMKIGALAFVAAVYFLVPGVREFINSGLIFLYYRDFEGLRSFILAYGIWAPFTAIAIMTIQSVLPVFVPGLIITITNAWIFGWQYGAPYSWTGSLIGALLDFGLSRWYGRPIIEKIVDARYLDRVDVFFRRHGVLAVFITRLTPIVPFKIISYGSGLTAISFFSFAAATAVGQFPAIVLYSVLGQDLFHNVHLIVAITLFLLLISIFVYYYYRKFEDYLSKNKEKD